MHGPDPKTTHPMAGFAQVCFIANTVKSPNIIVGDYTYYDDPDDSENFERNVLYHFPFIGDRLLIGKFCAIARGVKFVMNGANHTAKLIKSRFPPEDVAALEALAWWNWTVEKISANLDAIVSGDIAELQRRARAAE